MDLFVPGRICLFGELSDWAGGYRRVNPGIEKGYTLICGTDQGIYAKVASHPKKLVLTTTTPEGETRGPREFPMELDALLAEARRGGFWSYVCSVAYQILLHYRVGGLVIQNYRTDLPIRKGLSSSAAICVLAARAFNRLYDLKLTTRGEMELAYQGEITTPSRCGRMDQGCAFGNRPVLMTFDGDRLITNELQADGDLHLVVVDLLAQKDTKKILAQLNRCYPYAGDQIEQGVQDLLGKINRRIVQQAVEALQSGDARRLGTLMVEAQDHFDRYAIPACPQELAAPVLHRVLGHEPLVPHIWEGKGVGSQGDGSAQFVARSAQDQQAVVEIVERDLGMPCLKVTMRMPAELAPSETPRRRSRRSGEATLVSGDHQVRKAVIPVAGTGTRLFPATKAIKKAFFPIIDRDGIAKPAILLIVEEALDTGMEEVIVIVQERDLDDFRSFFGPPSRSDDGGKSPLHLQEYARRIHSAGQRISYVVQRTQDGFGHAVYSAREAVGGEPFLLMLGDHLYRSHSARSCAQQMLEAYDRYERSVLGLRHVPETEIIHYGAASGKWVEANRLLEIASLSEKPSADYARSNLRVSGLAGDEYLAFFGQYILKPQLFDYLGEQIDQGLRERGEYQLTSALDRVREEEGVLGLLIEGQCYDIGLPGSYLQTLKEFGPQ
ncbi:MAG: sugar phosphate nucleotidyltransferase [Anaerolineae bacterium]|jgi:UTP-glucose-1-phosphate uridylyltransferase